MTVVQIELCLLDTGNVLFGRLLHFNERDSQLMGDFGYDACPTAKRGTGHILQLTLTSKSRNYIDYRMLS